MIWAAIGGIDEADLIQAADAHLQNGAKIA
jgi:hypothetical protein